MLTRRSMIRGLGAAGALGWAGAQAQSKNLT